MTTPPTGPEGAMREESACLVHGTDYQDCPACFRGERNALRVALTDARRELAEVKESLKKSRLFGDMHLDLLKKAEQERDELKEKADGLRQQRWALKTQLAQAEQRGRALNEVPADLSGVTSALAWASGQPKDVHWAMRLDEAIDTWQRVRDAIYAIRAMAPHSAALTPPPAEERSR